MGKINKIAWLGAGEFTLKDAINVDIRKLKGIDVVADVRKLPFKDGEMEVIGSRNLIEHFGRKEIVPLLKEWHRCLGKEGILHIETVDGGRLMDKWREIPEENLLDGILGAQTYDENFHKMIFTEESLVKFLKEAGFEPFRIELGELRQIPRIKIIGIKK